MDINVLVVDDEEMLCSLMQEEIEEEFGYKVTVAENGKIALDLCIENSYSLIVTDFKMPIMNGGEFIQSVKNKKTLNVETPIILMTAYAPDNLEEILALPKIKFLKKPFRFENIMELINDTIKEN